MVSTLKDEKRCILYMYKMCVSSILFLQKYVELLSCGISSVGGRIYLKTAKMDSMGGVCIVQGIICIFRGRVCTAWHLST